MRLFEVQTPTGNPSATAGFESMLLDWAGGFSSRCVAGVWRDPKTGKLYDEPMKAYQVASETELDLARLALDFFPGEHAVFVAEVGHAQIVARGGVQSLDAANAA